jgi:hypothetical protein
MMWREKYITRKSQRTIGKLYKTLTRRQIKDKLNTDGRNFLELGSLVELVTQVTWVYSPHTYF